MRRETSLYLDRDSTNGMGKQEVLKALKIAFASTRVHVTENRNVTLEGPTDEYILLDREITKSVIALGISPDIDERTLHVSAGNVDFCLEDSFSGLFLSRVMFKQPVTDWIIIHLDDHADMMPTILLQEDGGVLSDPAALSTFDCSVDQHWYSSIASGSVNIGSYLTPLFHQLSNDSKIHIRHIRPAPNDELRDTIVSLEATNIEYPILGNRRFAAVRQCRYDSEKSTYMQTSSPEHGISNLPSGQIAVHVDLDFFINDFNGNAGTSPKALTETDREAILATMGCAFNQISTLGRPVSRWIIATSPGFCAARHWAWLLESLARHISEIDDVRTEDMPWIF